MNTNPNPNHPHPHLHNHLYPWSNKHSDYFLPYFNQWIPCTSTLMPEEYKINKGCNMDHDTIITILCMGQAMSTILSALPISTLPTLLYYRFLFNKILINKILINRIEFLIDKCIPVLNNPNLPLILPASLKGNTHLHLNNTHPSSHKDRILLLPPKDRIPLHLPLDPLHLHPHPLKTPRNPSPPGAPKDRGRGSNRTKTNKKGRGMAMVTKCKL